MASPMFPEYRFLFIGKSGSGKSSTANTLMGDEDFPTGFGMAACTKNCTMKTRVLHDLGVTFHVVDTPGLFDPKIPNEVIRDQIIKASACIHPGPHAVLFVIRLDRFTPEERETFEQLKQFFDANIVNYTIILFTRKDEMLKRKMTLEQVLGQAEEIFQEVLKDCGGRVIAIDNETEGKREEQVKELLAMVHEMLEKNGRKPYLCGVQEVVNAKLEARVTERTDDRIKREPELKALFGKLEEDFRQRSDAAQTQNEKLNDTLTEADMTKTVIAEMKKRERKKEEELKRRKEEEERLAKKRERERQEDVKRMMEEQKKKEKLEELKRMRKEEEKKLAEKREQEKQEEEDRRKQNEKAKKELEEMERKRKEEEQKLAKIEEEVKMQKELAEEKERLRREAAERIDREKKIVEDDEKTKTKEDIVDDNEQQLVKAAIGGVGWAVGKLIGWWWS